MNSTGLLSGGVLSVGAGANQFSITDGTGIIVLSDDTITRVSWSGKINIVPTNIATELLTWVAIDGNGDVFMQNAPFTSTQQREMICLGVAVHVDKTTVDAVNNEQVVAYQPLNTAYDIASALGFVNISGNQFSANGANLKINKSSGVMFKMGSNYDVDVENPHNKTLNALSPATFQYRFSDGSNGVTGTDIDPNNLDNGSGGLTPLANNQWSVQRIYSFVSNNVKIQRGTQSFSTKAAAIEGIGSEAYITEPSIAANGLLRGWLVVQKGATDLSNSSTAAFLNAPKFGEGTSGGQVTAAGDASTILLNIKKSTAGTLNVGQAVVSVGWNGEEVLCELADSDAVGFMPAIGIVREPATEINAGVVIFSGILQGVNTASYSIGDTLYVGTTAGALTNVRPTALGSGVQTVARVLSVNPVTGVIQVVGAGRVNDIPNFTAPDKFWYGGATGQAIEGTVTAAGRALLDDADATAQRATLNVDQAGTNLPKAGGTMTGTILGSATQTIASAATVDLATATSNSIDVTGTTTITSFGTVASGSVFNIRFTGALLITYNATSLILPTSGNITTASGDTMILRSLGGGNWKCIGYLRQDGTPLAGVGTYANYQANPSNPTGTSSTTGVMMGLAGSITPSATGKILFTISGDLHTNSTLSTSTPQLRSIRYGTGAAPTNGAALTGTALGGEVRMQMNHDGYVPFSVTGLITGASLGVALWLDMGLACNIGTGSAANLTIIATELP